MKTVEPDSMKTSDLLRRCLPLLLLASLTMALPAAAQEALAEGVGNNDKGAAEREALGPDLDAIRRFVEVYRVIKAAHVDVVSDDVLIESAIRGMLGGLDAHSGYLDVRALEVLTDDTLGAYDGLGVELISGAGVLQVIGAMPDSPAERAGLKVGDFITHVDELEVDETNMPQSLAKLRGRPGTRVHLTVVRDDAPAPMEMDLVRARIRLSTVRSEWLEPGLAIIHVAQCQLATAGEIHRQLSRLRREHGGELQGVVLDLRGNPGGALESAIAVSDMFLAEGRIVSLKGRVENTDRAYDARPGSEWERLPLAVLIDGDTASAAEIIAAALQSHGRASVLGERSFGKGSVQNIFALDPTHAVRLTTARYYTAKGESIHDRGVVPDIVIASDANGAEDADPVVQRAIQALKTAPRSAQAAATDAG